MISNIFHTCLDLSSGLPTPSILIIRNIYHFRCEWGRDPLLYEIIPVDGGEEVVGFDLVLAIIHILENKKFKLMFMWGKEDLSIPLTKSFLEPSLCVPSFSSRPCRRDQAVLDAPGRIASGLWRMLSYISCVSLL